MNNPLILGILNVTPDSFSDGGLYTTVRAAVQHAREMEREGANIIDIGGESTRPESSVVSVEEEYERVIPVLRALRKCTRLPISIDTYKADIAEAALKEGADIINDVTALRGDARMGAVVARYRCPVVLMYAKDRSARTTIKRTRYSDVIAAIRAFWEERIAYARACGIRKSQITLDPGMGHFVSAIPWYSFEIIARLPELARLGYPLLMGISRKSFLGGDPASRDERGLPLQALAAVHGARILRTHAVRPLRAFLDTLYR